MQIPAMYSDATLFLDYSNSSAVETRKIRFNFKLVANAWYFITLVSIMPR